MKKTKYTLSKIWAQKMDCKYDQEQQSFCEKIFIFEFFSFSLFCGLTLLIPYLSYIESLPRLLY